MPSKHPEEDLSKVRSISIKNRSSKVHVEQFVDPESFPAAPERFSKTGLMAAFPDILKGSSLRKVVEALERARERKKQILWLVGAHVIKCGLSLYLNALMRRGYLSAIATTGSATVHDLELAFFGATSEDVALELPQGRFGMAEETAAHFNAACRHAAESDLGLGEGLGAYIEKSSAAFNKVSVFSTAHNLSVPATVHVALGTDITHQHASFPGSLVGELSMRDFRIFTSVVGRIFDHGVVVVAGSAVILPEVFLKAVSIGYNLGRKPVGVTTVNIDMFSQYRVHENVLKRPFQECGESFSFNGHHEIMLPLLYLLLNGGR